jgi:hypothetical protein
MDQAVEIPPDDIKKRTDTGTWKSCFHFVRSSEKKEKPYDFLF